MYVANVCKAYSTLPVLLQLRQASTDFMDADDMAEILNTSLPHRFSLLLETCINSSAFAEAWLGKFKPSPTNIEVPF